MPADQADVIAANERLTTELATANRQRDEARTQLATLTTERDSATGETATLRGQLTAANAERDTARGEVTRLTTENTRLTGEMADFNRRVATELAKHGISAQGVKDDPGPATGKSGGSLTEQCLAARGK